MNVGKLKIKENGNVKNNFDLNQQYDNLCNAVIKMAAKDYKCAERRNKSFVKNGILISIKEIESFFNGKYGKMFFGENGKLILKYIKEISDERVRNKTKSNHSSADSTNEGC